MRNFCSHHFPVIPPSFKKWGCNHQWEKHIILLKMYFHFLFCISVGRDFSPGGNKNLTETVIFTPLSLSLSNSCFHSTNSSFILAADIFFRKKTNLISSFFNTLFRLVSYYWLHHHSSNILNANLNYNYVTCCKVTTIYSTPARFVAWILLPLVIKLLLRIQKNKRKL